MHDSSSTRIGQIADEIRALPSSLSFGNVSFEVANAGGRLLWEAIQLGAFQDAEYAKLRILVDRIVAAAKQHESMTWWAVWSEGIVCLVPQLSNAKVGKREIAACNPIADLVAAEATRILRTEIPVGKVPETPSVAKPENGGGDGQDEISKLEKSTPPLDKDSGKWVRNKRAAEIEGLETATLRKYRNQGIQVDGKDLGLDIDGRVWRREGTPKSHPWYLRSTLIAK